MKATMTTTATMTMMTTIMAMTTGPKSSGFVGRPPSQVFCWPPNPLDSNRWPPNPLAPKPLASESVAPPPPLAPEPVGPRTVAPPNPLAPEPVAPRSRWPPNPLLPRIPWPPNPLAARSVGPRIGNRIGFQIIESKTIGSKLTTFKCFLGSLCLQGVIIFLFLVMEDPKHPRTSRC